MPNRKHPDQKLTLREAFEKHYDTSELAPKSLQSFHHALNYWEKVTSNPPIGRIDDQTAAAFREAGITASLSPSTINGRWSHLRAILRRIGASEIERVKTGLGRWFLQHAGRSVTDAFYLNQMEELEEAIDSMRLPVGFASGPKMAVRAEIKARNERVKIHQTDFAAPTTPDPSEWKFAPGQFWFRGKWYRLAGDRWRVLKALAESKEPLSDEPLSKAASLGGQSPDGDSRHRRAIVIVSTLRGILRKAFGLAGDFDPVPCVYRKYEGRKGQRVAYWTLSLPVDLNNQKGGAA